MTAQAKGKGKKGKKSKPRKETEAVLRTLTYRSWHMMIQRCYHPDHVSYAQYGGRGITVHWAWLPAPLTIKDVVHTLDGETRTRMQAFANFVRDVGLKPTEKHTLDRLKPELGYFKDNVAWATPKEQGRNKRGTHMVLHPKTNLPVKAADLAEELKIPYQNLRARMVKEGTWYKISFLKEGRLQSQSESQSEPAE